MEFLNYGLLAFGVFNIIMSFAQMTKNFTSAVLFKAIPFIGGVMCVIFSLQYMNIINILN